MKDAAGAAHPPGPPPPGAAAAGPPPPGPTPPGPPPEVLPSALAGALAAFERHLRSERSLSPHTVRAYAGDIASLLAYASLQGIDTPNSLGVTELRGWLAIQHESGAARATLARRGAAARAFTAFAHRRGWLATDPGPQLGTPKTRRTLPHVLPRDEMAGVLTGLDQAARRTQVTLRTEAAERAGPTHPTDATGPAEAEAAVALRDWALLELLYATGVRVGEVCGVPTSATWTSARAHAARRRQGRQGARRPVRQARRDRPMSSMAQSVAARSSSTPRRRRRSHVPRPARGPPRPAPGAHGRPQSAALDGRRPPT